MNDDKSDKKDRELREKRLRNAVWRIEKDMKMGLLDSALNELKAAARNWEIKISSDIVDQLTKAFLKVGSFKKAKEAAELGASPEVSQIIKDRQLKFAEWDITRNIEKGRLEVALKKLKSAVRVEEIKIPSNVIDDLAKSFIKIEEFEKAKETVELGASPETCCIVLKAYIDYLKDKCLGLLNKN